MADDDNFDIDIYGDENQDFEQQQDPITSEARQEGSLEINQSQNQTQNDKDTNTNNIVDNPSNGTNFGEPPNEPETEPPVDSYQHQTQPQQTRTDTPTQPAQQIASTSGAPSSQQQQMPRQAPTAQGVKRAAGSDDREVDPGATSALRLGELQWWVTEDDVRGWANQCGCEDEVKEVTFNEYKVNGKSKG